MLQTLGLKIGSAAQHPVGVSLLHRPVPEHVQHRPGPPHSTTGSRTIGQGGRKPPSIRGLFPGRKR